MAHFAELDANNFVLRVIVVANAELLDENHQESEAKGIAFCQSLFGAETIWRQTSYNKSFRKNYAGIGFFYDPERNIFLAPKPYPSWTLNEDTGVWEPPIPCPPLYPDEGIVYEWNEDNQNWVEVTNV